MPEGEDWGGKLMANVAVGLVLLLLFAFSFRVLSFYQRLERGGLDLAGLSFSATQARAAELSELAEQAPGSGELATADDPSLGNPGARVTVVEFADFGCPYSEEESYVVRALAKEFPDTVRFIYRDFPLADLHPGADLAAVGGNCAHVQGKFWEFHDAVFRSQGDFDVAMLTGIAEEAGLNVPQFQTCLTSSHYEDEVNNDLTDGVHAGVVGTPTFFVNGIKVEGAIPYAIFKEILQAFVQG